MKRPGFTPIELIVALLIFGIAFAAGIYALNAVRRDNRDEKRIADIAVMRAGLSQYWLQKATFPEQQVDIAKPGAGTDQLDAAGFSPKSTQHPPIYLQQLSSGPTSNEYYRYHGSAQGYSIRFRTEGTTVYGAPGDYFAHYTIVDREDVEK